MPLSKIVFVAVCLALYAEPQVDFRAGPLVVDVVVVAVSPTCKGTGLDSLSSIFKSNFRTRETTANECWLECTGDYLRAIELKAMKLEAKQTLWWIAENILVAT